MPEDVVTMDKVVALCKRRGFIFPSSEIYGGLGSTYDYGHYGVLLKTNVKNAWWQAMLSREDIVALDSAILQHPRVWEASGHVGGFSDPMVDCRTCKGRFRADHVGELQCPQKPSKIPGEGPGLRPDRGARVQPHVRDDGRPGEGLRLRRLPAPRDGAGDLHQLQERPAVRAQEAAVRHRAGRQVVPQRDHARQLHLPHARVRADGDGVLRPARRGRAVVPLLDRDARGLVHGPRHPARPPHGPPARVRRALALLLGHERHRVPLPDRLERARGHRQPRRTSTSPRTPSTRARSSSTSTRAAASATSRTSSSRPPAPTARRSPSSSTPTTRRRSRASSAPC